MNILRLYYEEALRTFHESGGGEEDFYWLVGSLLARHPSYREELEIRKRLMEMITEEVKGKVLDVGCGTGVLTFKMALKDGVEMAVGIDKSLEVIEFCNRLGDKITKKAKFVQEDFLKMSIDEKFDCVVFSYVLHDFEPEPFLERALKVLEEGGSVIVGDFDINDLRERIREFSRGKGMKIVKDVTVGRAESHGDLREAFLMVVERL